MLLPGQMTILFSSSYKYSQAGYPGPALAVPHPLWSARAPWTPQVVVEWWWRTMAVEVVWRWCWWWLFLQMVISDVVPSYLGMLGLKSMVVGMERRDGEGRRTLQYFTLHFSR